jgi:hypothetical protein
MTLEETPWSKRQTDAPHQGRFLCRGKTAQISPVAGDSPDCNCGCSDPTKAGRPLASVRFRSLFSKTDARTFLSHFYYVELAAGWDGHSNASLRSLAGGLRARHSFGISTSWPFYNDLRDRICSGARTQLRGMIQ